MTPSRWAACAVVLSLTPAGNAWSAGPYWTGGYFGANAGGGVGQADLRTSVEAPGAYFLPADIAQIGDSGRQKTTSNLWTAGLQAGYDYQVGAIVYGLEADLDGFGQKASRTVSEMYNSAPGVTFTLEQSVRTDWLFTVRPRIGLAVSDFLFYATAGVAETRIKYTEKFTDTFNPALATDSVSKTRIGWIAGAGCEYALNDRWSIKGEYLYADFGRFSNSSVLQMPAGLGDKFNHSIGLDAHIVRLGLNFRFDGGEFGAGHPAARRVRRVEDMTNAPIYAF
jgi:outer membrane immunogenic protein